KPPSPDSAWNTALPAAQGDAQSWISDLAKQADARSSLNELLDTPIDFSNFIMHRLNVDTLTPDLLAGLTYELMRGSCSSLTELEYHLDNRGRRVIPFEHFINNDLEYLRGGASSRKYTMSVTKTKAEDYGHIKWIEDLVPREMWIQQPIDYNKHALWGVSHWGRKRKQFYGYAVNRESARDVYSKKRIIAVTELQIMEWHDYKHLDWISVRRDDDQIYKFKEGDFKRLRLQDIEDMLLLLVQGKLSNLTVEERLAFNVSLRMFTRSIVIKRRVEDLQLGVESYQKKLNLTKPDTYRSDLRRRVPDVPSDDSEEELSWKSSDDEEIGSHEEGKESDDDSDEWSDNDSEETVKSSAGKDGDEDDDEDDDDDDEEEENAKDDEEDKETGKGGDEVRESRCESEEEEETSDQEEGSFDPIPRTPEDSKKESDDEDEQESRLSEEARIQEEEDAEELYHDVNINQGRGLQVTQNVEDTHVILTPVNPDDPQESSSMSSFVSSMLNPLSDVGVESIFMTTSSQIVSLEPPTPIMTPSTIATITTSGEAPIPPPTIPNHVHEDEEMHGDDEKYVDDEKDDEEINDITKGDKEMVDAEKVDTRKALYNAIVQSLLVDEDDMDKSVVETSTYKRRHHDDEGHDPPPDSKKEKKKKRRTDAELQKKSSTSKESSKGKTPPKTSKTGKSATANPTKKGSITADENILSDLDEALQLEQTDDEHYDEEVHEDEEMHGDDEKYVDDEKDDEEINDITKDSKKEKKKKRRTDAELQKKSSTSKESSKGKTPPKTSKTGKSTFFNDLVNAEKDSFIFDELMATPIDFYKFAMNRLKLDKITKADLVGPTNPEGERCLYDLSKPLPLQGSPGHLTIPVDFFFNNDLEYLKTGNTERKYIVSITKTKGVSLVIKKRVKDVQLGVESYQKKLNIIKPQKEYPIISFKEAYTTSYDSKENIRVILHSICSDDGNPSSASGKYDESNAYVLEDSILQVGNHVKEIRLNSIYLITDEAFQGRLFDSFQDKGKYDHVGLKVTSSQEGERLQDDEKMMHD
nr:hypothetical protein [Tanacetum cinerariifolium]